MMNSSPETYQESFFAHQPVLDAQQKVWGYEIYFRDNDSTNGFLLDNRNEVEATREVLSSISCCPDQNLGKAKVIINFTEEAILEKYAYALHPTSVIVQLADHKCFSKDLADEMRKLVDAGYSISIDDYKAHPANIGIYRQAEVMTFNMLTSGEDELKRNLAAATHLGSLCLAKKIETQEQFGKAKDLGFDLFQGFFFQEPKIHKIREIPSGELVRFEILEMLCSNDLDFDAISDIISKDATLSVRLLKLLNSPAYGLIQNVTSLKQAAVYLGLEHLTQWLKIIILSDMAQPHTTKELLRVSLVRAKFLKNLGNRLLIQRETTRLFLLGLFSLLDSLYQMPMNLIMGWLPVLDTEIRRTLTGEETDLSLWLKLSVNMERSDWAEVGAILAQLGIDSGDLMPCYSDALTWANLAIQASVK